MGGLSFNKRQCETSLRKLKFTLSDKRHGAHDKWIAPFPNANPPFIMIPRHNELHCQRAIVKELIKMGGEKLVSDFLKNL